MTEKTFGVELENIPIQTLTHHDVIRFHFTVQIEKVVHVNTKISSGLVIEKMLYASPLSCQYAETEED
jgi:hypothetical protein